MYGIERRGGVAQILNSEENNLILDSKELTLGIKRQRLEDRGAEY